MHSQYNMLDFPKADRSSVESFNSNYLKTIIFQVKFANSDNVYEKRSSYLDSLKGLFPRISDSQQDGFSVTLNKDQTPILQPIPTEKNGVEMRSEDGQRIVAILKDGITYTLNGTEYSNFSKVNTDLKIIFGILNPLGIETINRIAIRKINIIDYEIPPQFEGTDNVSIMQMLLHPSLLNNMDYFPSKNSIAQSIHNVLFVKENITMNLRYGVMQPNILENKGQVLLDIDLFQQGDIPTSKTYDLLEEINLEIFNVFNWAMKPEAVERLMQTS